MPTPGANRTGSEVRDGERRDSTWGNTAAAIPAAAAATIHGARCGVGTGALRGYGT